MTMAGDLLAAAVQREQTQLDEKLFLEVFAVPSGPRAAPPQQSARNGAKARR
jgi:hypothetical protein